MPFPLRKYKVHPTTKALYTTMDLVDTIVRPAMVIPTSVLRKFYLERNMIERSKVSFYQIPYKFLVRDNWDDISSPSFDASNTTAKIFSSYETASEEEKRSMLLSIRNYAFPPNVEVEEEERVESVTDDDDDDDDDTYDDDNDDDDFGDYSGTKSIESDEFSLTD